MSLNALIEMSLLIFYYETPGLLHEEIRLLISIIKTIKQSDLKIKNKVFPANLHPHQSRLITFWIKF